MTAHDAHAARAFTRQMPDKSAATRLDPKVLHASSIDEAADLVRRCAEPRPAGDKVKAAIVRASRRLGFSFTRTNDIWYRSARRIDAREMDRLRQVAEQRELAKAVGSVDLVRKKMLTSRPASYREVAADLGAALRALGADPKGSGPEE